MQTETGPGANLFDRPAWKRPLDFGGSGPEQHSGTPEAPATAIPGLGASAITPGVGAGVRHSLVTWAVGPRWR